MSNDLLAQFAGALASGSIRVVDLTQTLRPSTPVIGLPPPIAPSNPFTIEQISRYDDKGPAWYWNNISMGEHTGTHSTRPRIGSPARISPTASPIRSTSSALSRRPW